MIVTNNARRLGGFNRSRLVTRIEGGLLVGNQSSDVYNPAFGADCMHHWRWAYTVSQHDPFIAQDVRGLQHAHILSKLLAK